LITVLSIIGVILGINGIDEDFLVFYAAVLALWAMITIIWILLKPEPRHHK